MEPEYETPKLNKPEKLSVQKVTVTYLYCKIAVDSTILVSISFIASEQANAANTTMKKVKKFLNYVASHQDMIVTYLESDRLLVCHRDASYLRKPR